MGTTSMRRRSGRTVTAAVAAALLVAATVTVAFALRDGGPVPEVHKDAAFLDAEHPGVLGFENGDCFEDPEIAAARGESMLATVECVGAQNEVITFVALDDVAEWDESVVLQEADSRCVGTLVEAFGPLDAAGYAAYGVPPTAATWADGDRDVMCVVYRPGESFAVEPLSELTL